MPNAQYPTRNTQPPMANAQILIPNPQSLMPIAGALDRVVIWGLPLARLDHAGTLDQVDRLIDRGRPAFFITANLHYAMLTGRDPRLAAVNRKAAFLVADGMPLVWRSRLGSRPLPARVAGADLIYSLCRRAAQRGYRVFFLGGAPGVAEETARRLSERYAGLQVAGVEAPELDRLSVSEHDALVERIRRSGADLLLVAFGQPKGELWLAENCPRLGVPACVQVGSSFDFVAGRVPRAPKWLRRIGLEWAYRLLREPGRLAGRYLGDGLFLVKALWRDAHGLGLHAS
jgi:N-acetylglucosaminyldiphosphoundecaprenol N-acetyl-beta-D-mannosaminyltransferase